jgi:hypothetical protein
MDALPGKAVERFREKRFATHREAFARQHVGFEFEEKRASARMDGVDYPVAVTANPHRHIGILDGQGFKKNVELFSDSVDATGPTASAKILETRHRYGGIVVHVIDKALHD